MEIFLFTLIGLSLATVLVTLGLGVHSMLKGGEYAAKYGNKFMRWRVTAQAVAVVILFVALFALKGGQ